MSLSISWATESIELIDGELTTSQNFHVLEFDAVVSRNLEGRSEITQHAVESGSPITDHKRATPRILTIEGFVTNTPIDNPPPSGFGSVNVSHSIAQDGTAQVRVFSSEFDRVTDVWNTLERLRLEAIPVSISSRYWDLEDVQIVANTFPEDTAEDAATFAIEVTEVRIAFSREVDAPAPREPRGARETDRGSREGEDATEGRSSAPDRVRDRVNAGETFYDATAAELGL